MSKPDLDIKIEEIKELVTTPDYEAIDKGVDLARKLNAPTVFEELLKDCSIRNDSEWDYGIVPGGLFVDTKKDASYLYYALLNLIGYVPKACNVDNSLINDNIIYLSLPKIKDQGNKLDKFPIGVCYLKYLKKLELDENNFTEIPSEIGRMENLELLNLGDNKITVLPPEITYLINLNILLLYDNKLKEIPDHIGNLKNLELLSLIGNELIKLPESISQLQNLNENGGLWLQGNKSLKIESNIKDFTDQKINHEEELLMDIINWSYENKLIEKQYTDEELCSGMWKKMGSNRFYLNIAENPNCPVQMLNKIFKYRQSLYLADDSDSFESEIEHTILNNSTFNDNLNNIGFGRFVDPETGEVIAKMQDGKLVALDRK